MLACSPWEKVESLPLVWVGMNCQYTAAWLKQRRQGLRVPTTLGKVLHRTEVQAEGKGQCREEGSRNY